MAEELYQPVFATPNLEAGVAHVTSFRIVEAVSEPPRAELELDVPGLDYEPRADLLGPAELALVDTGSGAVVRRFKGCVTRVTEDAGRAVADATDSQRLSMVLEPSLALLRLSRNRRIFQELGVRDIVSKVLEEGGVERVEWRLVGAPPPREVTTQLDEDNLAFVTRLLEEEGIFYFFEHGEEGDVLVLGDSPSAFSASPTPTLALRTASGLASREAILSLRERERLCPSKVTLRDHDFERPALDLTAEASSEGSGREHYDYPGRYVDQAVGMARAKARLAALAAAARRVTGESTAPSLSPGHTFTLEGAHAPELDGEHVVASVAHGFRRGASETKFSNEFELLRIDTELRPEARTPRPVVHGPMVAIVTGPPGEEIHCDQHGRVKVHFHWDRESQRDDKSSCWVRVSQLHTSGSVAIPRVGWEVLVDFEDGDVDRPIVLGRLYHPSSPPPYALPAKKTVSALKSTSSPGKGGYNELRMDDAAGTEAIQLYAQKDQNVVVANHKTETIGTSSTTGVGASHVLDVSGDESLTVGAQRGLRVGGSQTIDVGGSRTETVSAGATLSIDGSRTLEIGGSHTILTPMSMTETTSASMTETIGGSSIEVCVLENGAKAAGTISRSVGGSKVEAVAKGKSSLVLGACASNVGGARLDVTPKDVKVSVKGAKATTVGGALVAAAGGATNIETEGTLAITVGGAVAALGGSVVLKVGGSSVTLSAGAVVLKSGTIKLTATGPQPELAPMVNDK
jgi:type VI secretion system secreted protein VgrG